MINNNVIVVDDDNSVRTVLATALSRAGFNVKTSGTVSGLWRLIESEKAIITIQHVKATKITFLMIFLFSKIRKNIKTNDNSVKKKAVLSPDIKIKNNEPKIKI